MVDTTLIYELKAEKDCILCDKKIIGYGNNASPVKTGRCCDTCNIEVVIPTRLGIVLEIKDEKEVDEKELKKQKKREYMREYMRKRRQDPEKNEEMKVRIRTNNHRRWRENVEVREKNRIYCATRYQKVKEALKIMDEINNE
tara:strand:+ start:13 stop:438 length:426 start_codon:yes stop_codon:yes gene_type:complete